MAVPEWYCTDSARGEGWGSRGEACPVCGCYMFDGTESVTDDAWHEHMVSLHARVLADIVAKRQMVDLHDGEPNSLMGRYCSHEDGRYEIPCPSLRLLALPYADHPDFDPEWRIEEDDEDDETLTPDRFAVSAALQPGDKMYLRVNTAGTTVSAPEGWTEESPGSFVREVPQ